MDVQITDGIILGLAFFSAFIVAHIIYSLRLKKRALAFKDAADKFKKAGYKPLCLYNSDSLETLKKLEAGDFEGATHCVSYGIALFYHNECSMGLSKEFDIERQKIEELAKSCPRLAADIKRAAEMQKQAVEMKASRLSTHDTVA
jgi:hypothetical protein